MHFRNSKKARQDIFISDPINIDKNGKSLTLMDSMSYGDNIVDVIDIRLKSEKLYSLIEHKLDEREKEIVILQYGLC